jgi:hypothetical protein
MTPQRTRSLRSWARPLGVAVFGILLAVAAVVLEEVHFQNVASWVIGEPAPFRLSWFPPDAACAFWTHACGRTVGTDDLLAPILAVCGLTSMVVIAIKRRYCHAENNDETQMP